MLDRQTIITLIESEDSNRLDNLLTQATLEEINQNNAENENGETLLYRAVRKSNISAIKILLEKGADPTKENGGYDSRSTTVSAESSTPLQLAFMLGNIDSITTILSNSQDNIIQTLIDEEDNALINIMRLLGNFTKSHEDNLVSEENYPRIIREGESVIAKLREKQINESQDLEKYHMDAQKELNKTSAELEKYENRLKLINLELEKSKTKTLKFLEERSKFITVTGLIIDRMIDSGVAQDDILICLSTANKDLKKEILLEVLNQNTSITPGERKNQTKKYLATRTQKQGEFAEESPRLNSKNRFSFTIFGSAPKRKSHNKPNYDLSDKSHQEQRPRGSSSFKFLTPRASQNTSNLSGEQAEVPEYLLGGSKEHTPVTRTLRISQTSPGSQGEKKLSRERTGTTIIEETEEFTPRMTPSTNQIPNKSPTKKSRRLFSCLCLSQSLRTGSGRGEDVGRREETKNYGSEVGLI